MRVESSPRSLLTVALTMKTRNPLRFDPVKGRHCQDAGVPQSPCVRGKTPLYRSGKAMRTRATVFFSQGSGALFADGSVPVPSQTSISLCSLARDPEWQPQPEWPFSAAHHSQWGLPSVPLGERKILRRRIWLAILRSGVYLWANQLKEQESGLMGPFPLQ